MAKHRKSEREFMDAKFIDYCNERGINLIKWYEWRMHILNEIKKRKQHELASISN